VEGNGKKYEPKAGDPKLVLEIKNKKWIFTGVEKGEIIRVDPQKNPKHMDLKSTEKGRAGVVDEAVYKIEKDTLTVCISQGAIKKRRTTFKSPKARNTTLVVFKRIKSD